MNDAFEELRPRLFGIAYRILGTVTEAEDAVQDAWLAWDRVDQDGVGSATAYLTRTITNVSLNRIRTQQRRREEYVGPWLPEPIDSARLPDEAAEIADSVTFAMLILLDRLSPLERAAFVLREVFVMPHDDIATALGRSPAAVRQLVSRARSRLAEAEGRYSNDPSEITQVASAFLAAIQQGEVEEATKLLAPDIEFIADGGGKALAAPRPILGRAKVAKMLVGFLGKYSDSTVEVSDVNCLPALVIRSEVAGVSIYQIGLRNGLIERIWVTRNPDKLGYVTS